jgi:hypothetical protein
MADPILWVITMAPKIVWRQSGTFVDRFTWLPLLSCYAVAGTTETCVAKHQGQPNAYFVVNFPKAWGELSILVLDCERYWFL